MQRPISDLGVGLAIRQIFASRDLQGENRAGGPLFTFYRDRSALLSRSQLARVWLRCLPAKNNAS